MKEAGVNIVSLPVFSWPQLERTPGEFDFGWLDRVIDILWDAGIAIDLATATATPAGLARSRPPRDAAAQRRRPAARVRLPPGLLPELPGVGEQRRPHDPRHGRALRQPPRPRPLAHLQRVRRPHLTLLVPGIRRALPAAGSRPATAPSTALNEAWGTTVWGQHYTEWSHIEPPRTASGPINPTQQLDFERFSSDALLELFQLEIDVLREVTPDIAVTTNFMSLLRDLNYWDFAAVEDLVTDDAYPDPADDTSHVGAALNYSLMRSLKGGQPWLLLEQAPSAVSWRDINVPKAPGQMRIMSLHAIAHGSDGAMFFQWRQAKFGTEKFHSAMLGHRGEASRSFQETKAFGAELKQARAGARHPRARLGRPGRRLGLLVGQLPRPSRCRRSASKWAEQARAWNAAALRPRPHRRRRQGHRPVRRLRARRRPQSLHGRSGAGRCTRRLRRARRTPGRRPVQRRRRPHREGARRRSPRPAARAARRRGRRALADPGWRARHHHARRRRLATRR